MGMSAIFLTYFYDLYYTTSQFPKDFKVGTDKEYQERTKCVYICVYVYFVIYISADTKSVLKIMILKASCIKFERVKLRHLNILRGNI